MSRKYTREEIIDKAREVWGDKYEYGEYLGYNTKMKIVCPIHGEFEQTPHDHIEGHGCQKCFNDRRGKNRQMNTEQFIEKAKAKYGDSYDYSMVNYVDSKTKVKIKCNTCGHVFEQRPAKHLNANGCPKCAKSNRSSSQSKGLENFIAEAKRVGWNYCYDKFVYVNNKTPGIIICPKHGPFKKTPSAHIRQMQGCPLCKKEEAYPNAMTTEEFIEKAKAVYGDLYDYSKVRYVNYRTKVTVTCKKHGDFNVTPCNHIQNLSGCPKCANLVSKWENDVYGYITSLGVDAEQSNRKILNGKEIDIYIPEMKIGVECDGLIWHNEKTCDNNYHINKTNKAKNKGVRLIHIFEDEWKYKKDVVKSMLSAIFGKTQTTIYARNCEIKIVGAHEKRIFIDTNHIQGDTKSKVNIGLYHNGELVSVMTFGTPRVNLKGDKSEGYWELVRFCNKIGARVVGGASKLLSYFKKNYNYKRIVSYCDKRWFDGKLYEKLGFTHDHDSKPNYFYVINDRRKNRFQFRKDALVKEGYDPAKTEHQIMLDRGIYRIYDCGTKVYYL